MFKHIKSLFLVAIILGVGFVGGLTSTPPQLPVQNVALETTPGPYGSGVLGDWSGLSHGLYCFQPGTTADTSYTRATKTTSPTSSAAMACQGEDIRIYGDSITFGGKMALAAELNALGKTLFVDAWSGRPTQPVVEAIEAETVFPPVVIVASGTNDMFNSSVMAGLIARAKAHIKAVSPSTKFFMVDVQATRWGQTDVIERNDQRNSMAVNMAIWNNLEKSQIIQWSQRFMANPALLGNYLADGVHPKVGTGYAYWAAIVRSWLQVLGGI